MSNNNFFSRKDIGGIDENIFLNELKKANGKNEYYKPDIEDLRIGYECKVAHNLGAIWKPIILDKESLYEYLDESIFLNEIKTKYLTKEDIESLSWQYLEQQGPIRDYLDFVKRVDTSKNTKDTLYPYDIYLQYNFKTRKLEIYNDDDLAFEHYFQGTCKCINTLRNISKYLNIN